jgi:hypothetical protein
MLGLPLAATVKSLVLATDSVDAAGQALPAQVWLLLLRGDHEMNEVKVGKLPGMAGFRFATVPEIEDHFGCKPGYLGPIGLRKPVKLVVLLVSPPERTSDHIQALGRISRLMTNPSFREQVYAASDAGQLLELFRTAERG